MISDHPSRLITCNANIVSKVSVRHESHQKFVGARSEELLDAGSEPEEDPRGWSLESTDLQIQKTVYRWVDRMAKGPREILKRTGAQDRV